MRIAYRQSARGCREVEEEARFRPSPYAILASLERQGHEYRQANFFHLANVSDMIRVGTCIRLRVSRMFESKRFVLLDAECTTSLTAAHELHESQHHMEQLGLEDDVGLDS